MSKSSEQKTLISLAFADRKAHGNSAKPSAYWGLDIATAHQLDAFLKANPQANLKTVIYIFCDGKVK